jgi:hypothetical protein
MPTIDEIKDYLGIDYDDDVSNRNIKKYMSVADSWLKGAIGENYPKNDERAKQLALFVIEDLYDRGSYSVKENSNIEKLKNDFVMQLQCEGRK